MCGIAGIHALRGSIDGSIAQESLQAMLSAMRHRGPDGQGWYQSGATWLGHVRLAILDIDGGTQPMWNEDETVVVTYNGEQYGFEALRKELTRRHRFRTRTDTEVLVHLYEDVKESLPNHLNGMYAFALLDRTQNTLLIAVDPMGIKPLYYYQGANVFVFASELRALLKGLEALSLPQTFDLATCSSFLSQGWVQAPLTPVVGVRKLCPGESFLIKGQSITRRTRRLTPETASPQSEIEHLDETLRTVVRDQMIADVDVGLLLSGGIDSSILASIACAVGFEIKTFSVEFSGHTREVKDANESDFANIVARHLHTKHYTARVDAYTLLADLDSAFVAMDEPISDPAILPLLRVARFAKTEVKACLTGDGADELFGGYWRHVLFDIKQSYQQLPRPLRQLLDRTSRLSRYSSALGRLQSAYSLVADPDYISGPFSWHYAGWLNNPIPGIVCSEASEWLEHDLYGQLAGQMLPKTDRITMFCGLEARVPFLDDRVVRFAMRLPKKQKVRGLQSKVILRELLARYVPPQISRRSKHGFRVPLSNWFRHELRSEVKERLLGGLVIPDAIISRSAVERLISLHLDGGQEHSNRIWALLVLNSWIAQSKLP